VSGVVIGCPQASLRSLASETDLMAIDFNDIWFFDFAKLFNKLFDKAQHLRNVRGVELLDCLVCLCEHVSGGLATQDLCHCMANLPLIDSFWLELLRCNLGVECLDLGLLLENRLLKYPDSSLIELLLKACSTRGLMLKMAHFLLVVFLLCDCLIKFLNHLVEVSFKPLEQS